MKKKKKRNRHKKTKKLSFFAKPNEPNRIHQKLDTGIPIFNNPGKLITSPSHMQSYTFHVEHVV